MSENFKNLNFGKCFEMRSTTIGEPGNRTFSLDFFCLDATVKIWIEKQQLALLAQEITKNQHKEIDTKTNMKYQKSALEYEFKLLDFLISYNTENNNIEFQFLGENKEQESFVIKFEFNNLLSQKFAKKSFDLISKGRPICMLCFNPINDDGHFCIKMNGHIQNVKIK